jgi:uncharacterized protein YndB with AHSA1/START domain
MTPESTNDTALDGTIEHVGDQVVLRFKRSYPNSVADVWDAITNPKRIAQWWLPFDADISLELVAGGDYVLRGKGEGMPTLSWKVLKVEAPRLFEHTHMDPGVIVTWRLSDDNVGCVLVITQSLPDPTRAIENNFVVGLHMSLERLGSLLKGNPIEWDWDAMATHQRRYAQAGLATNSEE